MSILVLLVPTLLALPALAFWYWLIFRWPEVPDAQTRPLPVMAYEEPQEQALLSRAWAYLRDIRTHTR